MDQRHTFTGPDEIRPHVVKFLQDILDGKLFVRELSLSKQLDFVREPNGITSRIEPTGEETFTFEIARPRQ